MSDDLKTRLRTTTLHDGEWESGLPLEALTRIEELEAALKEISEEERLDHINGGFCLTDGAIIARTALAAIQKEGGA